jgi:hypothetical protein
MKSGIKALVLILAISLAAGCLSFLATLKLVIEPRYEYLNDQGIFDELDRLRSSINMQQLTINDLEEQIEYYKSMSGQ